MFEKLDSCPVCTNDSFSNHIICEDHFLSGESFAIVKCSKCQFLFTNPRPDKNSIGKYYDSDEYISHTSKSKSPIDILYKLARQYTLANKLRLINKIAESKSILDFGCGTGDFLAKCKANGWTVNGLEPNSEAREIATLRTRSTIHSEISQLEEISNLGLITLWHVLEHIHDLNDTLSTLTSLLSNHGKVLIAVPNYQSFDAQLYKEFWAAYDVPRHLYHFSQDSMKSLLQKHDLKILDTIPMKLDAYYVTLLSQKYKFGAADYIKSFINGYKSNTYAKKHQQNYSSLIYIAGK